jgi:hypothetical protein
MLYLGSLGALLGAALGIGDGVARRSAIPAVLATLLGAGGGVLGGLLACIVQEHTKANVGLAELKHTLFAQLAACLPLAVGIALGLGLATRSAGGLLTTLLTGLGGGALAAVVYPLITSTLLPGISTDSLLPEEATSRLMWLGLMSGLIGLIIPIAGRRRRTQP